MVDHKQGKHFTSLLFSPDDNIFYFAPSLPFVDVVSAGLGHTHKGILQCSPLATYFAALTRVADLAVAL